MILKLFIEIFLPKTMPMTVGMVYPPPSQTSFLEIMNEHFYKLDAINKETYILGDFNVNLYLNNKYVFEKCPTTVSNAFPYDVRKYQKFCNFFSLKQLVSCPTRISRSSSTIIDHILTSYPHRVSQKEIIDIVISDHQLIFCTRKIAPCKTKRVKDNSKEWFDSVASEGINDRDKLFKKFKKSRLPLDQKNCKNTATKLRN